MKRLILIAIAFISIQAFAQQGQRKDRANNQERSQRMSDLSPEDAANLQTKKMTLLLDLNDKQQKDIYKINLENAKQRNEMMATFKAKKESGQAQKPTDEQRLAMTNAKLDHQIAMKAKMKSILTADQYTKWEKNQSQMAKKERGNKKGEGQRGGNQGPKQG